MTQVTAFGLKSTMSCDNKDLNASQDNEYDILLAEIVSKSFLVQDRLKPLKKWLIDILMIANQNYIHKEDRIKLKEIISDISFFSDGSKKRCREPEFDGDDESKQRESFKSSCDSVTDAKIEIKKLPPTVTDVQDDSDQEMFVPDDCMSVADDSDLENDNSQNLPEVANKKSRRWIPRDGYIYRCPEISCQFHETGISSRHLSTHVGRVHPEINYDIRQLERIEQVAETAAEDDNSDQLVLEDGESAGDDYDPGNDDRVKRSNGRLRYFYKCPVTSCIDHERGISSQYLKLHVRNIHPQIVYDIKTFERVEIGSRKKSNLNITDSDGVVKIKPKIQIRDHNTGNLNTSAAFPLLASVLTANKKHKPNKTGFVIKKKKSNRPKFLCPVADCTSTTPKELTRLKDHINRMHPEITDLNYTALPKVASGVSAMKPSETVESRIVGILTEAVQTKSTNNNQINHLSLDQEASTSGHLNHNNDPNLHVSLSEGSDCEDSMHSFDLKPIIEEPATYSKDCQSHQNKENIFHPIE